MFCVVIIVVTNKNKPLITNKIVLIKQLSLPLIEFTDTVLENIQALSHSRAYILGFQQKSSLHTLWFTGFSHSNGHLTLFNF